MHERTGGNPFYVGELTRLLVSERQAPAGTAVPTAVRDVVRQRLARLPDRSLEVLAVAAVLGPEIDLRLLTAATGLAADRCLDDLDPAVVTRILVPSEGGRFRFGHALVRDAVLADISPLRLARLHQRAADAITAVYGTGRDHAEPIAAHRWAASSVDDPGAVVDAQLRAAAVARGRAAMTTAAELVDRAFEAAKAMPAGHEPRAARGVGGGDDVHHRAELVRASAGASWPDARGRRPPPQRAGRPAAPALPAVRPARPTRA